MGCVALDSCFLFVNTIKCIAACVLPKFLKGYGARAQEAQRYYPPPDVQSPHTGLLNSIMRTSFASLHSLARLP